MFNLYLYDGLMGNDYAWLGEDYMWGIVSLTWFLYELYMRGWRYIYICVCSHEFGMSNNGPWWLVIQWHGIGMRGSNLLVVGNNELVLIQPVINEGWLRMLVWGSYAWYLYLLLDWLYMFSMWSVHNSLKSLGGTLRSCFSGRDVIPWPLLVGAHGGSPSI